MTTLLLLCWALVGFLYILADGVEILIAYVRAHTQPRGLTSLDRGDTETAPVFMIGCSTRVQQSMIDA